MMSACIVAAQAVMLPIALLVGRKADAWGRKPLFLIGFAALFAWQVGGFIARNRPLTYAFGDLPKPLLP